MADFVRKRFEPDANTATANTVLVGEFWGQIGLANIVDETIVDTFGQSKFICNVHHLHEMVQILRLAYSLGEDILDVAFPDFLRDFNGNSKVRTGAFGLLFELFLSPSLRGFCAS